MPYRIENEHLSHRAAQSKLYCILLLTQKEYNNPQTLPVVKEELHARQKFARQRGSGEGDKYPEHVQHLLEAKRRGFKARNDNILLHATYTVHA